MKRRTSTHSLLLPLPLKVALLLQYTVTIVRGRKHTGAS
jgi:hypothetical protein